MFKTFIQFVCIGFCLSSQGFSYGNAGHEVIGTIAEHYLRDTRAEREVKALLHDDEDLARAATWADRAKIPEKYLTAEMKEFVANNPEHHAYHYCDIPFQEKTFREGITGTNPQDIIHTLRICIEVLKSPEPEPENPLKINKRVALLLIAHLIGDLHQPLHVGCSYIDEENRYVNPETGAKGQEDAGGNYLKVDARTPLHGYWDTQTVKLARDHAGAEDFTAFLIRRFPPQLDWDAIGPVATWPELWANDSLALSRQCFEGVILGERKLVPKDEKHEEHFEWSIIISADYPGKARDIVEPELAKGGYRLAALLIGIWPDDVEKTSGK